MSDSILSIVQFDLNLRMGWRAFPILLQSQQMQFKEIFLGPCVLLLPFVRIGQTDKAGDFRRISLTQKFN